MTATWATNPPDTTGTMIWSRTCALALAFASRLATVCADLAETYPVPAARDWEVNSAMQMSVSASEGDVVPLFYAVIPLTTTLGLNQSQISRGVTNFTLPPHLPSDVC